MIGARLIADAEISTEERGSELGDEFLDRGRCVDDRRLIAVDLFGGEYRRGAC